MTLRVITGGFDSGEWRKRVRTAKDGSIIKSHNNVCIILELHPDWSGKIRYDEFAGKITVRDAPFGGTELRPWSDQDDLALITWVDQLVFKDFPRAMIAGAVEIVARDARYHPVREYLNTLVWDGTERVSRFFVEGYGAPDSEYSTGAARRWLVSAVARAFKPGCKADCLPVLEGLQGVRKSSGLRALFGDSWFSDSELRIGHTDGYAGIQGKWCCEIQELSGFSRNEMRAVKGFLSSQVDHYRGSYERRFADRPRGCVFAASTNESNWQKDETGGRRFWPIACSTVNLEYIRENRDQIWAEATALYRSGATWWTDTDEFRLLAEDEQAQRLSVDEWEEPISKRLAMNSEQGWSTLELLRDVLNIELARMTRADAMRVAVILRKLGYNRKVDTTRAGARVRLYYKGK